MLRSRRKKRKKQSRREVVGEITKRSILKITVLLLLVGLNWTGLSAIGTTLAYYNDTEDSDANSFVVGSLDFSLTLSNFTEFIGLTEKLFLGSVLTNSGSLGFQYTVASEKISGSDDFCSALELEAELNGVEKHDDALMSFDVSALTTLGSWSFEVKLPVTATNISHGENCEVDLVFKGWQTDVATYEDGGFSDEERIHLKFTSRMVVLNEFLPRPAGWAYGFDFGDDSSLKPQGEWVELYNNSNTAFNLASWYLWDNSGDPANKIEITTTNTAPTTTVIGAHSWLVVYMNKEVLDNTGDTVKLFDGTNTLIDSYTYTSDNDYCEIEPTPGDENTTDTTGDCGGVPPNKSYARIPDGIGSWVDPIPTPGLPNRLSGGEIGLEEIAIENINTIIDTATENTTDITENTLPELIATTTGITTTTDTITLDANITDTATGTTNTDTSTTTATTTDATTTDATGETVTTTDNTISTDNAITTDNVTVTDDATTTEEISIIEEINEIIDGVIDEIVEEIIPDEPVDEEIPIEDIQVIDETATIEEVPTTEEPVIEEEPIKEEAPVDEVDEPPADETYE